MSHVADQDQTQVDRQERICAGTAERLGLTVADDHRYVDNNRSAWKRNRRRPGWDAMIAAIASGEVRHIVAYHPDRLMRQPKDLEQLLDAAETYGVVLHGEANRRDLSDPDDRFFLRLEVAHACRSSDDTSRRRQEASVDRAMDGKPHTGMRQLGYSTDTMTIIEDEADTVRRVFDRYLSGQTPSRIAADLNQEGILTVRGKPWTMQMVSNMLHSRKYAGILVFRGEEIGQGIWPPIIDLATWKAVQDRRVVRSAEWAAEPRAERRFYLLRGLIFCGQCGTHMAGSKVSKGSKGRPTPTVVPKYRCTRTIRRDEAQCNRSIYAEATESFVEDAAVRLLTELDVTGRKTAALVLSATASAEIEQAAAEIEQLRTAWKARDIKTHEFVEMRRELESRITRAQGRVTRRPTIAILEGITGPGAAAAWAQMRERGEYERMNAILRFLFAAVRIGPATKTGRGFDYGRLDIEPNDL